MFFKGFGRNPTSPSFTSTPFYRDLRNSGREYRWQPTLPKGQPANDGKLDLCEIVTLLMIVFIIASGTNDLQVLARRLDNL